MAKSDINRLTGKYGPPIDRARRSFLQDAFNKMDRDAHREKPRIMQLGPKSLAIKAYLEGGREKAYSTIQKIYVRKNGEISFSKEQINCWIDEYENSKKKARDDDDAR